MRDAGRSWTEIADRLGITVPEAKAAVRDDKTARREGLARTPEAEDRNGLRDVCAFSDYLFDGSYENARCTHPRKDHEDFSGQCQNENCPCDEFVEPKSMRAALPWWRDREGPGPEPVQDVKQLSSYVSRQARQLGVQMRRTRKYFEGYDESRKPVYSRPEIPQPRLETLTRRARKKLQKGKKLKRHYDAPKRGDSV
jgi:hypothetical protein